MYNLATFNTTQYNGNYFPSLGDLVTDATRFNNLGLSNSKVLSNIPQYDKPANLVVDSYKKPGRNGFGSNSQTMGIKNIKIRGTLVTESQLELEELIDQINDELNVEFGNLDIKRADGTYRRYVSKASGIQQFRDEHYHLGWCPFEIDFEVYDGVGMALTESSSGALVDELVYNGNHVCRTIGKNIETPSVFIFAIKSADSVSKLTIKNNATGDEIDINTSFLPGDFLYVDGINLVCYKISAGVRTDLKPVGRYITLAKGENPYLVTTVGTSISTVVTVKHIDLFV